MKFLVLFIIAAIISSIGFKRFVWFISLGYGFSIAGIGIALFVMFHQNMTIETAIMSLLLIIYGCRLGGYLMIRERKSKSYQNTMKNDIKDGSDTGFVLKIVIWLSCALLYVCEASPILFRLHNDAPSNIASWIGMIVMAAGIILEAASDLVKNNFKKEHPDRFCDTAMFRLVRCPNYLGEVLTWTGVFISGFGAVSGILQWIAAIGGWIAIVYIMFGGARRLEIRQNKNYGSNPEYQAYVKKVPILLPFIPLYSVEKYKWLVG